MSKGKLLFHAPTVSTSDSSDTTSADRIATLATKQDPRCQQLAALEAEIGRAVIANYIVNNSIWSLDKDWSFTRATNDAMNILNKCLIVEGAIVGLIAQWRELHAEGAEAEAATERQEEK